MIRAAELRTLWHMLRGQPAGDSHAARLEAFYRPQAGHYDAFRERLLAGRAELIRALDVHAGQRVLELGAGTGRTAEFYAERVPTLQSLTLVDLCPSLLRQARLRTERWLNCVVHEADAAVYRETSVDRLYFSYALSMMPQWRATLHNAIDMLTQDGLLGVVDFYVSDRQPPTGFTRHGPWTRRFWPWWFGHDGVRLDGLVLRELHQRLEMKYLHEGYTSIPWLPGARVPYFIFVGRARR